MPAKKLLFLSSNFTRTYALAYYVAEELARHFPLEVWAYVPKGFAEHFLLLKHTPYDGYLQSLPVIRHWLFDQMMYYQALRHARAIVTYDLRYYHVAVRIKKRKPAIPFIHFAPELLMQSDYPRLPWLRSYHNGARLPELTVDVNMQRAAKRKELFGLTNDITFLPNTVPKRVCDPLLGTRRLQDVIGRSIPNHLRIVVYTGGLHDGVMEEHIADALRMVKHPYFFVAFCHGLPDRLARFRAILDAAVGPERCHLNPSINRDILLSILSDADLGLVYYPQTSSSPFYQVYAAPGKFYEYVAAGLGVVSSGNPTLVPLIDENSIGACCKEDSAAGLAEALSRALVMDFKSVREKSARLFREEWCFESMAPPVIRKILQHIRQQPESRTEGGEA